MSLRSGLDAGRGNRRSLPIRTEARPPNSRRLRLLGVHDEDPALGDLLPDADGSEGLDWPPGRGKLQGVAERHVRTVWLDDHSGDGEIRDVQPLQVGHDLIFAENLAANAVHDIGGKHSRELLPILCFHRGPEEPFILLRAGRALESGWFLFSINGAAAQTNGARAAASRLVIQILRIALIGAQKRLPLLAAFLHSCC